MAMFLQSDIITPFNADSIWLKLQGDSLVVLPPRLNAATSRQPCSRCMKLQCDSLVELPPRLNAATSRQPCSRCRFSGEACFRFGISSVTSQYTDLSVAMYAFFPVSGIRTCIPIMVGWALLTPDAASKCSFEVMWLVNVFRLQHNYVLANTGYTLDLKVTHTH